MPYNAQAYAEAQQHLSRTLSTEPYSDHRTAQERANSRWLVLEATIRIKRSVSRLVDLPDLLREIAKLEFQQKALEYQFARENWPIPDYELWKHPPVPADWDEKHPKVEIEYRPEPAPVMGAVATKKRRGKAIARPKPQKIRG